MPNKCQQIQAGGSDGKGAGLCQLAFAGSTDEHCCGLTAQCIMTLNHTCACMRWEAPAPEGLLISVGSHLTHHDITYVCNNPFQCMRERGRHPPQVALPGRCATFALGCGALTEWNELGWVLVVGLWNAHFDQVGGLCVAVLPRYRCSLGRLDSRVRYGRNLYVHFS
jgi:hypothetical protein